MIEKEIFSFYCMNNRQKKGKINRKFYECCVNRNKIKIKQNEQKTKNYLQLFDRKKFFVDKTKVEKGVVNKLLKQKWNQIRIE